MFAPILGCIFQMGGSLIFSVEGIKLESRLADYYGLTDEQRNRTDPACNAKGRRIWRNHIQYAREKMKRQGLLLMPRRDVWRIANSGYDLLSRDSKVVERFSTASPSSSIRKDGSASSELDESSFPEGKAAYRLHRKLERDTGLAKIAKQKRLNHAGRLICDVCDFDFFETYGVVGQGFIEAHHTTPVSELRGKTRTKIDELALVCSNCHRMLHRRRPWLTLQELKQVRQAAD